MRLANHQQGTYAFQVEFTCPVLKRRQQSSPSGRRALYPYSRNICRLVLCVFGSSRIDDRPACLVRSSSRRVALLHLCSEAPHPNGSENFCLARFVKQSTNVRWLKLLSCRLLSHTVGWLGRCRNSFGVRGKEKIPTGWRSNEWLLIVDYEHCPEKRDGIRGVQLGLLFLT